MTTDTSAGLSASPHNMGGSGRVQVCNNMVVLCVCVYCDSPEVELCLYVLPPRLGLMLPKKEVQCSQLGTISLFHFPSINNTTPHIPPTYMHICTSCTTQYMVWCKNTPPPGVCHIQILIYHLCLTCQNNHSQNN